MGNFRDIIMGWAARPAMHVRVDNHYKKFIPRCTARKMP
jgi:hypothetical protein